jgi:hypothetical protein
MRLFKIIYLSLIIFFNYQNSSFSQVIPVNVNEKGVFFSSDPTKTFLWESNKAKVTLIFIPGGEGSLKLSDDRKDLKGFYGKTLKPLSDSTLTSGKFNVVVFDSPWPLAVGKDYPTSRTTSDHLARIESVVDFYRNKYNKPIWLMGHSNGAVSVTEFYKYLQKNNREKIISGIIYSSARNGATFNAETNIPVLFLAHERDGCSRSSPQNSQSVFNDLKKTNKFKTEYIFIKGGESEGEPCHSGYHMFFEVEKDAYKAIDLFSSEFFK